MPLVVTGAAGFIRHVLVGLLTARGLPVVGIERRSSIPAPAEPIVADLVDAPPGPVDDALAEADAVFHLAGLPGARAQAAAGPGRPRGPVATRADTARCHWRLGFTPRTELITLLRRQAAAAGLLPDATPAAMTARMLEAI